MVRNGYNGFFFFQGLDNLLAQGGTLVQINILVQNDTLVLKMVLEF